MGSHELAIDISNEEIPGRSEKISVNVGSWDAVVGLRGRIPLGESSRWLIPYYLDIGTGDSDFTWQASTGIAYGVGNWATALSWRYLYYDLDSGSAIADSAFNGRAVVFEFVC